MALKADGWHMATHAGALAIAALAYRYARKHVHDVRFSFGTGKLGDLAGYSSALILGGIAVLIGFESVMRLLDPVAIGYNEATVIAVVGLGVNLMSAWLLRDQHEHHDRDSGPGPPDQYKVLLSNLNRVSHVTTEVHACRAHLSRNAE